MNTSIIKVYPELEELEVTPTLEEQELTPDKYGFSKVLVNGIPATDLEVTATEEEQVADGIFKKVYVNSIPTEEKTIEPDFNNVDQIEITPTEESYLKKVTLIKDIDLDPANIKKGRNIFGIDGEFDAVDTRDATATTNDIVEGTTAYVNNEKIEGNVPNNGVLEYTPSDEEQAIPAGLTAGGSVLPADITTLSEYEKCLTIANSIEDMNDYSDTTATAEDIVEGKIAYSNGERIVGTLQNYNLLIDTSISRSMKSSLQSMLVKAKDLDYSNVSGSEAFQSFTLLEEVSFKKFATNRTDYYNMFQGCTKLKKVEGMTPLAGRTFQYMFQGCTALEEAPSFDCPKAIDFSFMFNDCTSLREIPRYSKATSGFMAYGMKNMIAGCPNLSDTSLNNIMGMCKSYSNAEQKSLAYIGFSQAQAERCKTLSNYDALVNAGWDMTGY